MRLRVWSFVSLLALLSRPVAAAPDMCPLDVSNPAITHTFLPMHGGAFQGISGYGSPSQWVYHSIQGHLACPGCNGMPFDESLGILNPASVHIHLEWCSPDGASVKGPFTIPARMRAYHDPGLYRFASGDLTQNVTFSPPQDVPWHDFPGDPMGVAVTNFVFTFNPFIGNTGPNIHAALPNGWTNFEATATVALPNGNYVSASAMVPVFTELDHSTITPAELASWSYGTGMDLSGDVPTNTDFYGATRVAVGVTSVADGGSGPWGSQIAEMKLLKGVLPLPFLGAFDTDWPFDFTGYMYGGQIGFTGEGGSCEMRVDMDLHNGNAGRVIDGLPAGCTGTGVLHPDLIGTGKHSVTLIWNARTGSGVPITRYDANGTSSAGLSAPNESAWALYGFNVEVGPGFPQPTTCQDPNAPNFGGPLPCQPPVIVPPVCVPPAVLQNGVRVTPPVTVWSVGTVFSHPTTTGVQFELCPGSDPNATTCQPK